MAPTDDGYVPTGLDVSTTPVRYVCERCGGYGVTCVPGSHGSPDEKQKCGVCLGHGHVEGPTRLWSDWTPEASTVAMLDRMPGYPHNPKARP